MHCLDFFSVSMNFGSDFPKDIPFLAMGNRPTCQPFSNGHGEVQSQFPSELPVQSYMEKTSKTEDTQPADLSWTRLLRGGAELGGDHDDHGIFRARIAPPVISCRKSCFACRIHGKII